MARHRVMSSRSSKKKVAAVTAGVLVGALMIGGAFAWRDFSQSFLNVFRGGSSADALLHDDFQPWEDKDVYVENPGDQPILVRVRFDEFFQIGNDVLVGNATWSEGLNPLLDPADIPASYNNKAGYVTYLWDEARSVVTSPDYSASPYYIPTTDGDIYISGQTDIAEYFVWALGGDDTNKVYLKGTSELGYVDYSTKTPGVFADGVFDSTGADIGDNNQPFATTGEYGNHLFATAAPVLMSTFCNEDVDSTLQWNDGTVAASVADVLGSYVGWILDDTEDGDGWAYWSQPLEPAAATSVLLSNAYKIKNPEDNWNYNINVVMHTTNKTEYNDLVAGVSTVPHSVASECAAALITYMGNPPVTP